MSDLLNRKKCGLLDRHICPLKEEYSQKGVACDGCELFELYLELKSHSMILEKENK